MIREINTNGPVLKVPTDFDWVHKPGVKRLDLRPAWPVVSRRAQETRKKVFAGLYRDPHSATICIRTAQKRWGMHGLAAWGQWCSLGFLVWIQIKEGTT